MTFSATRWARRAAAIGLATLVACGGGGGGGGSGSSPVLPPQVSVAPSISANPVDQTVLVGASASFTVGASGDAPLLYAWFRNGQPIAGATGPTYTLSPAKFADSGARFSVTVANALGSATSTEAVLTVQAAPGGAGRLDVWSGSGLPAITGAGTVTLATMPNAPGSTVDNTDTVNVGGAPGLNAGTSTGLGFTWAQRIYGGDFDAATQTVGNLRPRWLVYIKGGSLYKLGLDAAGAVPQRLSTLTGLVGVSLVAQSANGDDAVLIASAPVASGKTWAVRLSMGAADAPLALSGAIAGLLGQPFLMGASMDGATGALGTLYWWSAAAGGIRVLRSDLDGGNARTVYTLPSGNIVSPSPRPIVTPSGMVFVESAAASTQLIKRFDFATETVTLKHQTPPSRLVLFMVYDGDQVYAMPVSTTGTWDLVQVPDRPADAARALFTSQSVGKGPIIGFTPNYVYLGDGSRTLLTARKSDGATFTLDAGVNAGWSLLGLSLPTDRVFATASKPAQIRGVAPDGSGTPLLVPVDWSAQTPWRMPSSIRARCWACVPSAEAVLAGNGAQVAWVELRSASLGTVVSTSFDAALSVGLAFARTWGEGIGLAPAIAPTGGTFLVFSGSVSETLNTYYVDSGSGSLTNMTRLP